MRLTKMQVSALADKIIGDIQDPISVHNSEVMKTKAYQQFWERSNVQKLLKIAIEGGLDSEDCNLKRVIETMKKNYFKDKFIDIPRLNRHSIENDIIVSTIEYNDLDDLIISIKSKYKN